MIGYLKVQPNSLFYTGIIVILLLMLGSIFFVAKRKSTEDNKLLGIISLSWRFELTKYNWVRKILKNRWFSLIPILINLAFFTVILPNGSYILHVISDPFAWGWDLFGTANFPWTPVFTGVLPYIQVWIICGTFMIALSYGFKLALQTYPLLRRYSC